MNKYRVYKIICLGLFVLNIISCQSLPEKKIDSIYIMIYDHNNSEVMNVAVYIDEKLIGNTDVYGRLMCTVNESREYRIKAVKEGYETIEETMYIQPGILVYFKIDSGEYYAELAEKYLDENKFSKALMMIDTALKIQERKDWRYLKQVIQLRTENEN